MSNRCNDLGTPDRATPDDHTDDLTEGERVLLAHLAALVAGEHELPRHVEAAAKALHDWARVDDCLAEIAAPAMLTRADDHAFDIDLQQVRLHADVEPAGYRRRRLGITVSHAVRPAGGATPESISALRVQFPDGRVEELHADPFGEYVVHLPHGTVRLLASLVPLPHTSGSAEAVAVREVASPWFTA